MGTELLTLLFVFAGMIVFPAALWWFAERDIKARIQARRIKEQQVRDAAHAHWARLIQEEAARNSQRITAAPIVSFQPVPHNPGRRRILKLE